MSDAELTLRPMVADEVAPAVAIIDAIDEDDAQSAEHSYREMGLDNQFVLAAGDDVIGVTGFRPAKGSDHTCWVSWTYVHPDHQGKGYGGEMLELLLDHLRKIETRKVYVSISDYVDEDDGAIYAVARKLYKNAGFIEELVHPDYYAVGESEIICGLRLVDASFQPEITADPSNVFFNGLLEIDETEGAYVINWEVKKRGLLGGSKQFTKEDLEIGIEQAREWQARNIFISFPSNLPSVTQPLIDAGFFEEGRLDDYYEDGIDEVHFRYNLSANNLLLRRE